MAVPQAGYGPQVHGPINPVAATEFSPSDLLAGKDWVWYDPTDISTLWKDVDATDPVTTDGDLIARIDDKSGNGYHIYQSNASIRPAYRTAMGGRIDINNGLLTRAAIGFYQNGGATFVAAIKGTSGNIFTEASTTYAGRNILYTMTPADPNFISNPRALSFYIRNSSNNTMLPHFNYAEAYDDAAHVISIVDTENQIRSILDNGEVVTNNCSRSGELNCNSFSLGGLVRYAGTSYEANCLIGQLIGIKEALSDNETRLLNAYVMG